MNYNKEFSPKINDFEEYLNSFLNFEKLPQKNMFWLDTMEFFLNKLGNPHLFAKTVHIAGSKGKGSTSAMISSILEEDGLKTGLYTSPHIVNFLERITENQTFFPNEIYEKSSDELKNCVEKYKNELKRPVTWFELVTIFAFICFKNANCDCEVLETGLGGRLDATNICKPEISCISTIELEHTEFLGDTLEKIAFEKGGIIKENTPVIIAKQIPSVKEVFKKISKEKHTPIFFIDEEFSSIKTEYFLSDSRKNQTICINNNTYLHNLTPTIKMKTTLESKIFSRPLTFSLSLLGEFQAQNAALASFAVKKAFPFITEEQIEKGLEKTKLEGRLEIINNPEKFSGIPYLILDGAHTPNSIDFTLQTLNKLFGKNNSSSLKNFNLLFSCAKDKDIKDISVLLKKYFDFAFITKPGNVKQSDLSSIKKSFEDCGIDYDCDEDFILQIKKALTKSNENKSPLLVTGSFYLVSEVKKFLNS